MNQPITAKCSVSAQQSGSNPLSLRLKSATRQAHAQLEQTAVMRHLMSDALTLHSYVSVLAVWQQVWTALDAALQAHEPAEIKPEQQPQPRAALIARDLAMLKIDPVPVAPVSANFFDASATRWYGLAYVSRGSELGGAVIARQIQRQLDLPASHGTLFFAANHASPNAIAANWRQWLHWLDAQLHTEEDQFQAIQAASSAFESLATLFEINAHHFQEHSS